jgi:hypothetical protein
MARVEEEFVLQQYPLGGPLDREALGYDVDFAIDHDSSFPDAPSHMAETAFASGEALFEF